MIYAVIFQRRKIQNDFCCFISGMYNWSTLKERDISKNLKIFSFYWKENSKMVTWLIAYKTYRKIMNNMELLSCYKGIWKKTQKTPPIWAWNIEIFSPSIGRILIRPLLHHLFNIGNKSQLGKNKSKSRKTEKKKRITRKSYCTWREEIKCDYSEIHYLFIQKIQRNIYVKW